MFQQILVPTDGAPGLESVTALALELADASTGCLHSIAVTDTSLEPAGMPDADRQAWRAAARAEGQAAVGSIADRASDAGLETATAVREGTPHQAILSYVEETSIDLVVMGMYSGEETYPPQLGSTTERLIAFGDVPVIAAPPEEETDIVSPADEEWTIVVATDGSEVAQAATEQGLAFAAAHDGSVEALHVVETGFLNSVTESNLVSEAAREAGEKAVESVEEMAEERGLSVSTAIREGDPATEILAFADSVEADLVVMGERGIMSPFEDMLGGTVGRVIRRSERPVLVTD